MTVITHTQEEHTTALAQYMPDGALFEAKNINDSNFRKLLKGFAGELFTAEGYLKSFRDEFIPDQTNLFLSDWERTVGIPDECFSGTGYIADRRRDVLVKLASLGVQTADDFEAIVYLSETTPAERRDAVAATGRRVVVLEAREEVTAMLRHMRHDLGARVLLVEGGPTMNGELFARGLVDEYFITLGPVIVGGAEARTAVRGPLPPTLDSVTRLELVAAVTNPETSELYLRYRIVGRGAVER